MHLIPPARIHLIAICGTAMAALAGMLKESGFQVSGSDAHIYPPMSTLLESLGIEVKSGFQAERLSPPPDLVVVGNAVSRGNPEVEAMLNQRLPYMSMPEALRELFLRGRRPLVITGTHGKTTTTAMAAHLLSDGGLDPSFLIAGAPGNFPRSFHLGKGDHFVVEGDEYDSAFFAKTAKFFHYMPEVVVVNNIEFDHADIYPDLASIVKVFGQLINMVPKNGLVLAGSDDLEVARLMDDSPAPVQDFGLSKGAYWQATEITSKDPANGRAFCEFTVSKQGHRLGRVNLPMFGDFNVRNALAAIAVGSHAGLSFTQIQAAVSGFEGVRRRQEIISRVDGITIIDDFAHHPTAVSQTLSGLRAAYGDQRVWAVFEPASATNARARFEPLYVEAFSSADHVIVTRVPRPERSRDDVPFSAPRLVEAIAKRGISAHHIADADGIVDHLMTGLKPGDLVVFMSNGSFTGVQTRLVETLERTYGT